jgi:hypothetical protein
LFAFAETSIALEDRSALHARDLAGDRARDVLPEARDVTLASVREVEPPRFATETKAIAFSSHQLILSTRA